MKEKKAENKKCILCSYGESVFVENPKTGNQWVDCFKKCERKDGGDTCDAWEPRGQHWVD